MALPKLYSNTSFKKIIIPRKLDSLKGKPVTEFYHKYITWPNCKQHKLKEIEL